MVITDSLEAKFVLPHDDMRMKMPRRSPVFGLRLYRAERIPVNRRYTKRFGQWIRLAAAALSITFAGGACGRNKYEAPPPSEVTVVRPTTREVTTYNELSGWTAAIEAVDVRARVQGYLQSVNFKPGENVKKGDLLFVIEPTLYEARVAQAAPIWSIFMIVTPPYVMPD